MRFRDILGDATGTVAPGDTIYETSYAPDRLTYAATTAHGGGSRVLRSVLPMGMGMHNRRQTGRALAA